MKFRVTICCLLINANFTFFANGAKVKLDSEEDVSSNATQLNRENDEERWKLEYADFPYGLKMKNINTDEFVELTLGETPSKASLGKRLDENIKFRFYTKTFPNNHQEVTLDDQSIISSSVSNYFRADRPTVFITHGWISDGDSPSCTLIRDEYLKNYDLNVIVVDWSDISFSSYEWAVKKVPDVGLHVAAMIDHLETQNGLNTEQTILVGHSLGAHIFGIAAFNARGIINTIFGLDPTLPLFKHARPGSRISHYDAKHVQIIHTNAGVLGYETPIGRSDFYPNGGVSQLNCLVEVPFVCSHSRAFELFAESINSSVGFWGKHCTSAVDFWLGICRGTNIAKMGGIVVDDTVKGSYYLATKAKPPYAMGIQG